MGKIERIFYINTMYTLFLALVLYDDIEKNYYFLEETIPERIRERLMNKFFIKNMKKENKFRPLRYLKTYLRTKKIENILKEIGEVKGIYIQDHIEYGQFFMNYYDKNVYLLEDGTKNYNLKILEEELARENFRKDLKFKLLYSLKKIYKVYGLSNRIEKIILTGILPIPDLIKNRVEIVNLIEKWNCLSKEAKEKILNVFGINLESVENLKKVENKILLITQPLSEDDILTEEEKLEIYREIISKNKDKKIYIKPHPREKTDYKKIFLKYNIEILRKEFPIEILLLLKIEFEEVITLFSTAALNFKEKYRVSFLGTKNYPKLYEEFGEIESYFSKDKIY